MNSKLRVLMLSLFAVLFAAACVFALDVEEDSENSFVQTDTLTEGYNYRNVIIATFGEYNDDEDSVGEREWGPVSWEIYPLNSSDNWLKFRFDSEDNSVIYVEGILPAYDTAEGADNDHGYRFVPIISADVENPDYDSDQEESETNPVYIRALTSKDVEFELNIDVAHDETSIDVFPDMVSIDASAAPALTTARKDNYSVIIDFPMTTAITIAEETDDDDNTITTVTSGEIFVNAALEYTSPDLSEEEPEPEIDPEYINLPSWLAYEVLETQYQGSWEDSEDVDADDEDSEGSVSRYIQYDDSTIYVKKLRIFYSADSAPEEEVTGTVRIVVTPASTAAITDERDNGDDNETTEPFSDKYSDPATIGWNVTFSPIPPISLDKTEATIPLVYPASRDVGFTYATQTPAGEIVFVPDISASVELKAVSVDAGGTEPGGTITVTATPKVLADAVYSTDMIVTDTEGLTATVRLTISVDVPSITLSDSTVSITAAYGGSADKAITYTGPKPVGYTFSKSTTSLDEGFGLTVVSDDSAITIKVAPTISADWTGTLTILDEYKKSADIALTLKSVVSGDISVNASGDIPASTSLNQTGSTSYTLSVGNAYKAVKWSVNGVNLPVGMITPTSGDGSVFTFVINALRGNPGSYTATITAEDESGRTAGSYPISWTVNKSIEVSPDHATIAVEYGSSADTTVTRLNQQHTSYRFDPELNGSVDLSVGTAGGSNTVTITAKPLVEEAKLYTTNMILTDAEGFTATFRLNISVDLPFAVSPDNTPVTLKVGESKDVEIKSLNSKGTVSYSIASVSGTGASVVSTDTAGVFTVTGLAEGTYRAVIKATDARSGSTSEAGSIIVITVTNIPAPDPGTFALTPAATPVTVEAGSSADVSFTVSDNSGDVTWTLGDVPSGVTVVKSTNTDYSTEHNTLAVYTVTGATAGKYEVRVTATDSADNSATGIINITVTKADEFVIVEPERSLSIGTGASEDISFTASNNSGKVTWTLGDIPTGVTVTATTSSDSLILYRVVGVTAGEYEVKITATDTNSHTAAALIKVTVIEAGTFSVTPETQTVNVGTGASEDITLTAHYNSGDVTWTVASVTGVTVARATDVAYLTKNDIVARFTVAGVTAGDYSVEITATDAAGNTAKSTLSVTVIESGTFAVTPAETSLDIEFGTSQDVAFSAYFGSGDITWTTGTAPTGLTVAQATGVGYATQHNTVARYTVTAGTGVSAGPHSITITATDEAGKTATATLTVTVSDIPVRLEVTPATANVSIEAGSSSDVTFRASNNVGNVTWTAGTASTGITVTSGGNGRFIVTIAPTVTAGSYSATVTATDSAGYTAQGTISITVTAPTTTFAITQPTVTAAIAAGASRDVSFSVSNNIGAVTWTLGTLPTGITVTPATQTGTSASYNVRVASTVAAGSYPVTVTATDSAGRRATGTINITVSASSALTLSPSTTSVTAVIGGSSSNVSFTVSGNSGNVTWTVGTTPAGVTVTNNGNGSFSVTATSSATTGSYTVTVTATDAAGNSTTGTISITVRATIGTFSVSPATTSVATVAGGSYATISLAAVNNSGTVTWTVGSTPSGVTVTSLGGGNFTVTAGSSASAGDYTVTVTATDSSGRSATAIITISVEALEAGNTEPEALTTETLEKVAQKVDSGALVTVTDPVTGEQKVEIPSNAIDYTPQGSTDSSAKTLSKNDTTEVKQGEAINPVKLVLEFPVDIWRIYLNGELVAWAYSPGVTAESYVGDSSIVASERSSSGVTINPKSKYEADVTFETSEMPSGNNEIETAFVEDVNNPTQEIGKTTLATVEVAVEESDTPAQNTSGDVGIGGAGGGCSTGLGAIVSALAAAFFIGRRRS